MGMLQTIGADRRRKGERRQAARLNARGAAVSVAHDSGVAAALVGDVSRTGARIALDRPVEVGAPITIAFGPGVRLTGRVAWVEAAECGIEFDEAVAGLAADYRPQPGLVRSDRRGAAPAKPSGSGFRAGLNVTVVLPDCERKAVLRWTEDNCASLTLS